MPIDPKTIYPNGIDSLATLPKVQDLVDSIDAAHHNNLRDAIVAIEQELGTDPSSVYATVSDRLDNMDTSLLVSAMIRADTQEPTGFIRTKPDTMGELTFDSGIRRVSIGPKAGQDDFQHTNPAPLIALVPE